MVLSVLPPSGRVCVCVFCVLCFPCIASAVVIAVRQLAPKGDRRRRAVITAAAPPALDSFKTSDVGNNRATVVAVSVVGAVATNFQKCRGRERERERERNNC